MPDSWLTGNVVFYRRVQREGDGGWGRSRPPGRTAACRHLIADRLDIGGARWGLDGAEAVLTLRAVISNGDFEEYWRYHLAVAVGAACLLAAAGIAVVGFGSA